MKKTRQENPRKGYQTSVLTAICLLSSVFVSFIGTEISAEEDKKRVVVNEIVFYVFSTSRKGYVRVQRSETETVFKSIRTRDILEYQDKFLAQAARIATGCEVDLDASKMTERTCLLCTPQFFAKLNCN